ncbi:MAG: hypothetical protein KJ043_07310 [Anaerolineae bacterium]|nr:hypothetical protein [Anaerolineae bacterium]
MRLITRLLLVMMLIALTVPALAQEETDFDPEADFTNTYTYQNISLAYPDVLTPSDNNFQITLAFDDTFSDYITIATPQAFEYFEISNDDLETASQAVFETFIASFEDTRTYEEAVTVVEFAGYENVHTFIIEADGLQIHAYTFMIGEDIFAVTLITQEAAFPADVEIRVLERVIESMLVDELAVTAEATADIFAEATPDVVDPLTEITPSPVITMQPRTAPEPTEIELASEITLYEGAITLTIPNTWVVVEEDYTLATSNAAAEAVFGDVALDEGEIALQVISPERMSELGLEEITILSVTINLQSQFPDMVIYAYDGLPYKAYFIPVTGIGVPDGAFFFTFQLGENPEDVGVIIGVTPDYDSAEALIIAIVNTIVYTPVETEE